MASLEVLLNDHTVSAFSARQTRQKFIKNIDLALKDVDSAYASVKAAARRSPVKQALKLLRRGSKLNCNVPLGTSPVLEDENASVVSLARDVSFGRGNLLSFQLPDILLLQRALRTRRNSLAFIACLPTEVLTPILELAQTIYEDKPDFRTAKFVLGLTVSHVCRRWREIALKSSKVWTNIVLSRPRWALEMLHRSRAAPLVIGVDFSSTLPKNSAARDLVLAQLFRVQELHLYMPDGCGIPASILLPAPLLDTFHLQFAGPSECFITATLFQAEVPRLRHMSLHYCQLELDSALWENLVSLELVNSPVSVALLATMPHLRALTLNTSFPETSDSEPTVLDLDTVDLTGSIWLCCRFLQAVSIPKSRILLNVRYTSSDLRFLWDALERHRTEATDPVIYGLKFVDLPLKLNSGGTSSFEIDFYNQANRFIPRYVVRLSGGLPSPWWRDDTMSTLLAIMSLEQVAALSLKCETLKISASLLHLKHFRSATFHRDVAAFTDQLECDPLMTAGDRFDPVNAAVHYPRLRKIAFHDIAFSERHIEIILDWLAQRKRLNLVIEEIRLVGCTLTTADWGSLKELVGHVYAEDG
ncbi:hypothetical protein K438DRAFT_1833121 [Mycena galopus ATCC 62051]|nr:hypothetical protein K438DRAFT_1833121 [Mycena galopus ATCC 62051]